MGRKLDFYDEPFEVEIKDGNAILIWSDRRRVVPLRVFRIEHRRAGAALAVYDANRAEIVPLRLESGGEH